MKTLMAEKTIGGLVRDARERAGISQRELARRTGITPANLSRIESDQQEPTISKLRDIAAALGVDLHDLIP